MILYTGSLSRAFSVAMTWSSLKGNFTVNTKGSPSHSGGNILRMKFTVRLNGPDRSEGSPLSEATITTWDKKIKTGLLSRQIKCALL